VDAPDVSSSGSIACGHINDLPAPEIVRKKFATRCGWKRCHGTNLEKKREKGNLLRLHYLRHTYSHKCWPHLLRWWLFFSVTHSNQDGTTIQHAFQLSFRSHARGLQQAATYRLAWRAFAGSLVGANTVCQRIFLNDNTFSYCSSVVTYTVVSQKWTTDSQKKMTRVR
jgi:hypothetical protein